MDKHALLYTDVIFIDKVEKIINIDFFITLKFLIWILH